MASVPAPPAARVTARETLAVAAGLAAIVAAKVLISGSTYLLQKYFWTDELATHALITDPSLTHALSAMRGSVDINPPGIHILLWGFTALVQSTSEVALRTFAVLAMLCALTGVYVALRDVFSRLLAFTATLAIWSHPLILDHAFEVRYYGPWLAASAWFCVLLGRARRNQLGRAGTAGLALSSFFMCTAHYFGIVTWLIVVGVEWLVCRKHGRLTAGARMALAAGPIATAAAVILLLPTQRAATTVTTWVPAASFATIEDFASTIFLPLHLTALLVACWLWRWAGLGRRSVDASPSPANASSLVGLGSLALLVPALIVFSLAVQSVLISRYGLVAIAAFGPLVASGLSYLPSRLVVAVLVLLIAAGGYQLHQRAKRAEAMDDDRRQLIADIRTSTGSAPVGFEAPHHLNVVWHYARDLRDRLFLIDFNKGELGDNVSAFRIWSRDLAKAYVRFYEGPRLIGWSELKAAASIYVVPHPQAYVTEPAVDRRYPLFTMRPVRGRVHELVRTP